jgi:hypothetical protein
MVYKKDLWSLKRDEEFKRVYQPILVGFYYGLILFVSIYIACLFFALFGLLMIQASQIQISMVGV